MPSFNKVILCGNLVRDPELKYTPKGTAICRIGLAVNRTWTDQGGEKKEEVTFVDCDSFGKTAETIQKYLTKGKPLLVEGQLKLDTWTDKATNQPRSKLGVIIETFSFFRSATKADKKEAPEQPELPAPKNPDAEDNDVPF